MAAGDPVLLERIARHGLTDRSCASTATAAALTCAIQAQDGSASRLGIRTRAAALTESDVVRAIDDERSVVRTWLMRGTVHLVDAADVRWLVRLLGPAIGRKYRTQWRHAGLTDDVIEQVAEALPDILAERPLPRARIRDELAARGVVLPQKDPQALTHTLYYASSTGLICRGAGDTFALLDSWVPASADGPSGDDALAEIARRYFAAFSPATAADFTMWSGLPSGRAIALIRDELTPVEVFGKPGFRLGSVEPGRTLCLLAGFDNYLLGYRDREAILHSDLRRLVYDGGIIRPAVLHDGVVLGSWSLRRATAGVTVRPFTPLGRSVVRAIEAEVADLGRFVGRELDLEIAGD